MGSDFSFASLIYRVKYQVPTIPEEHREQRYQVAVPEVVDGSPEKYFLLSERNPDPSLEEWRDGGSPEGSAPPLLPARSPSPSREMAALAGDLVWLKTEWPALVKTLARELALALAPLLKTQRGPTAGPAPQADSGGEAGQAPAPFPPAKADPAKIPIDNLDGILEYLARENAKL